MNREMPGWFGGMSEGEKKRTLADAARHEKQLTEKIPTGEREDQDEDEPADEVPEQMAAK